PETIWFWKEIIILQAPVSLNIYIKIISETDSCATVTYQVSTDMKAWSDPPAGSQITVASNGAALSFLGFGGKTSDCSQSTITWQGTGSSTGSTAVWTKVQ